MSKWYVPYDDDEKVRASASFPLRSPKYSRNQVRLRGEVHRLVAPRDQKYQSNFVEVSSASADRLLTLIVYLVPEL